LRGKCRSCCAARHRAYREANKEKIAARKKAYKKANPEKIAAEKSRYQKRHKKAIAKRQRLYRAANRETIAASAKAYREANRHNVEYKLRSNIQARWSKYSNLPGSPVKALGCSIPELKKHLERQFNSRMTWENWGTYWQIDHIYPVFEARVHDRIEFLAVCNFRNLQPLERCANSAKRYKVCDDSLRLFKYLCSEFRWCFSEDAVPA
jgi:hypothetical protein